VIAQSKARVDLQDKMSKTEYETNKPFQDFHKAMNKMARTSTDKVTTVGEIQKFLEYETAYQQFQLDYAIPYPDKTMEIVEEFFTTFEQEETSTANKEVVTGEDEEEDEDHEDDTVTAGKPPVVVAEAVVPPTKKSFFSFV
jgi:hypothetical protein